MKMTHPSSLRLLSLILATTITVGANAAMLPTRAPAQDDIGYLPRPGSVVQTNPPVLAWLPEPDAAGYTVQLARDDAFTRNVLETPRLRYVLFTHTETLAPGDWWWRYAAVDGAGNRTAWSEVRRFTIAADAHPFPRPTEAAVRRTLPDRHPRLMLRPEEVAHFRRARTGPEKQRWETLVQEAEAMLAKPLIPEPPRWTNGKWNVEEWRRNSRQAVEAASAAETLAFCYLLSGERRFGEGARKWLLHIASWDPRGTTGLLVNNEAAYPVFYLTARAYDWAFEHLSAEDRATLREMARIRGGELFDRLVGLPYEQKAFHSHGGRIWHFLGEGAIAYHGELAAAEAWLDYALTIFWGPYPAYGDEDGGWAQGYTYWSSYVGRSTWWLDALKAALRIDGTEKPFYRNVGAFPMYVSPPGGALTGFGDFAERRPNPEPAAVVGYFASLRQQPEWQWYAEAWGREDGVAGPIGFLRATRPASRAPAARAPVDWPTARLFRGAGWVSLNSDLIDGRNNVQVMLRAAPLGNGSHSHADQNNFIIGAYGSPLLVNTGVRPWYGSPFTKAWYFTTKAHNALEIDGEGQPKTWEASGEIVAFVPGDRYDYVVGDATASYRDRVSRYRRHLVFLKPEIVVILDEVTAPRPVSLKFWLHGRAPFTFDESEGRIGLEFEHAGLHGYLRSAGGLSIGQTDQYTIPPEAGEPAPEWHLWAETKSRHAAARLVAVMGIAKAGTRVELADVREHVAGSIVTVEFLHGGRRVRMAFDTSRPAVTVE